MEQNLQKYIRHFTCLLHWNKKINHYNNGMLPVKRTIKIINFCIVSHAMAGDILCCFCILLMIFHWCHYMQFPLKSLVVVVIYKSVIDSTKIGFFYQVLEKMKDINQLQAFIPESLNKLRQYDIQKNGELVDTLECYLNVNQSLKKTSELMFIHYRTVSYRLQKIIEITNIDFNNPAEVLSVRIGLIAIRVLEVM